MLSRRCKVLSAPLLPGQALHLTTLRYDSRAMSRLSRPLPSATQAETEAAAAAVPTATALPSPQKAFAERWHAMQSLAAVAPSYFSGALQSRFTQVPTRSVSAVNSTDDALRPRSPHGASPLSSALALLRRVSYLDHLYSRLGLSAQQSTVSLSAEEQATLTPLARLLRRQPHASAQAAGEEGFLYSKDGGGKGNKGGSNNNNSNNNKGGQNNKDNAEEGEEEDKPEDWIVPRTCLFVLLMIVLTVVLYQLSRPSGKHIGWASLNQHAGEIKEVALYQNYLQVYMDDAKVYLGVVSDHDTQRHIDELAANYRTARAKAVKDEQQEQHKKKMAEEEQEANKKKTSGGSNNSDKSGDASEDSTAASLALPFFKPKSRSAADKPEELDVTMKGAPLAETALVGVGVFAWVVPFIFFPVFVMFLSQYIGKSMSYAVEATKGKSKVKEMIFAVEKTSSTRFRDVAGMKEPKKEITEIVDFLRHPERYTKLGAKIPTGAMLLGPPGTGKTLLAKAVAGESGVAFIPAIGSDFVELYVGMGALRVRQLFKEARKQRCIIYIDEIDAIGLKRQGAGHGEKQEQEQTLNELLTQLDGFSTGKRGDVMVLASSNVAQEALDPALIRPGRFDRIIHVDTPVISERIDIFKVHLSKLKLVSNDTKKAAEAAATDTAATTETSSPVAEAEEEQKKAEEKSGATAIDTTPAATTAATANDTTTTGSSATSTGGSLMLSSVEAEKQAYEAEGTSGSATGKDGGAAANNDTRNDAHDFDFRALLMQKSDAERAMIDVYAERMSNLCPGFVGADIANVCNEGAILAAREGADHVDISHLERSIDRVLAGIEHRSRAMSDFEKNVVAHHEAGHAVAGWFLNRADPLMKVSIVPRGGSALGYAQYLPNENYTRTAKEIRDSISVTLGGRVAEQIFFNHLSTGASDDLRKVGRMAYQYVSSFAPGSVYPAPGTNSTRLVKPFGVNKSNDFDRRAKALVDDVYADTVALLTEHKEDMKKLADHLLKHELLTYSDVVHYLGTRSIRQTDKRKGV